MYVFNDDDVVGCDEPVKHVSTTVTSTGTEVGAMAEYTCIDGYTALTGEQTRTCLSEGIWSGSAPTCSQIGTSNLLACILTLVINSTSNLCPRKRIRTNSGSPWLDMVANQCLYKLSMVFYMSLQCLILYTVIRCIFQTVASLKLVKVQ